jgi:hypothetical protein
MNDGTIQIGTQVDISGIRAGMAEAQATIKASTANMSASFEDLRTRLNSASAAFTAAAKESGASTQFLNKQMQTLHAEGVSGMEAMERSVAALRASQAAEEADAAAAKALAAAKKGAAAATRELSAQTSIVGMEMRVFEGSTFGMARAAGTFATQALGLGPILSAAFPIIGAAAMLDMLFQLGKGVVTFAENASNMASELNVGWLDGAIGEMIGLDKAVKQTDDRIMKLAQDKDRIRGEMESATAETITLTKGPAAGDYYKAAQLQQQISALEKLRALDTQRGADLDKQASSEDELSRVGSLGIAQLRQQETAAHEEYMAATNQELLLIQKKNNLYLEAQKAQNSADVKAARPEQHMENQTRGAYLSEVFEQTRRQNEQLAADTKATQESISASFKREAQDAVKAFDKERKAQEETAQAYRDRARQLEEGARASFEQSNSTKAITEAQIQFAAGAGNMSKLAAEQARAAAEAKAYAEQIQVLKNELAQLTPATEEYKRVQQQIAQMQTQQTISGIQNNPLAMQHEQIVQQYMNTFSQINDAWLQVANRMMYSTRDLGLQFAKMGQGIAISVMDGMEKAAAAEVVYLMTSKSSNASQRFDDAKTAAANSYKWASAWGGPIAGAVAAAVSFAAVASFDEGTGYVPKDGLALIHQGEAVIPAPTMQELRGSSADGGDIHIHQQNNWNTMSDREFQRQLERHAAHVAGAVRKHLRQGGH